MGQRTLPPTDIPAPLLPLTTHRVVSPSGVYTLQAESDFERAEWMAALQARAATHLGTTPASMKSFHHSSLPCCPSHGTPTPSSFTPSPSPSSFTPSPSSFTPSPAPSLPCSAQAVIGVLLSGVGELGAPPLVPLRPTHSRHSSYAEPAAAALDSMTICSAAGSSHMPGGATSLPGSPLSGVASPQV